ncbi:hypothetical protein MAR_017681 [Mya arenaria]|uniref:Uncharacterized protein n=1 Tax=Mya arenaria TaxID=6604 RepID=A0ABY7ECI7_MYAAR|nr:hypothetical protein MAR_017681 [Mya arenaria]
MKTSLHDVILSCHGNPTLTLRNSWSFCLNAKAVFKKDEKLVKHEIPIFVYRQRKQTLNYHFWDPKLNIQNHETLVMGNSGGTCGGGGSNGGCGGGGGYAGGGGSGVAEVASS